MAQTIASNTRIYHQEWLDLNCLNQVLVHASDINLLGRIQVP